MIREGQDLQAAETRLEYALHRFQPRRTWDSAVMLVRVTSTLVCTRIMTACTTFAGCRTYVNVPCSQEVQSSRAQKGCATITLFLSELVGGMAAYGGLPPLGQDVAHSATSCCLLSSFSHTGRSTACESLQDSWQAPRKELQGWHSHHKPLCCCTGCAHVSSILLRI